VPFIGGTGADCDPGGFIIIGIGIGIIVRAGSVTVDGVGSGGGTNEGPGSGIVTVEGSTSGTSPLPGTIIGTGNMFDSATVMTGAGSAESDISVGARSAVAVFAVVVVAAGDIGDAGDAGEATGEGAGPPFDLADWTGAAASAEVGCGASTVISSVPLRDFTMKL